MRTLICFLLTLVVVTDLNAQAPQSFNYQAVLRDASGKIKAKQSTSVRIDIAQTSASGVSVYAETFSTTTNDFGTINLQIGSGTIVSGMFDSINWASGPYFMKVTVDGTEMGSSQLLSVPYALYAKTTESVPGGTQIGQMQYWNGSAWVTIPAGKKGNILAFVNNAPMWVPLVGNGDVLNPTTGKVWMDKNLGASQVATSSTDAAAFGDLYQWGRAADGHQLRTSGTTLTLSSSDNPGHANFIRIYDTPYDWRSPQNDNLWQGVNGTNNPCPAGYRLPTKAEWEAESKSWSDKYTAGAFASPLKLTVAGYRIPGHGGIGTVNGEYWSSTVAGSNSYSYLFNSSYATFMGDPRATGHSVRCIKD